jgi:hypothetical protein
MIESAGIAQNEQKACNGGRASNPHHPHPMLRRSTGINDLYG